MAIDIELTPPCPAHVAEALGRAGVQVSALRQHVAAYAAEGEPGSIVEARRLARILEQMVSEATGDIAALAGNELEVARAIDIKPTAPGPAHVARALGRAGDQLDALTQHVAAYAADGKRGSIVEARCLARILQQLVSEVTRDIAALAENELQAQRHSA